MDLVILYTALYSEDLCVLSSIFRPAFKVLIDIFGLILFYHICSCFLLVVFVLCFISFVCAGSLLRARISFPARRAQALHGSGPLLWRWAPGRMGLSSWDTCTQQLQVCSSRCGTGLLLCDMCGLPHQAELCLLHWQADYSFQ